MACLGRETQIARGYEGVRDVKASVAGRVGLSLTATCAVPMQNWACNLLHHQHHTLSRSYLCL